MEIVEQTFNDYNNYLDFLKNKTTCDDPVYTANHERQHLEKATALGYDSIYGAKIVGNDFPHIFLYAFVDFPSTKPTSEHLIEILLAPDTPGEHDLKLVSKLRKQI